MLRNLVEFNEHVNIFLQIHANSCKLFLFLNKYVNLGCPKSAVLLRPSYFPDLAPGILSAFP